MVLKTYNRSIKHSFICLKLAGAIIFSGNTFDGFRSKTKSIVFGGYETSFFIDVQGTGKCIFNSYTKRPVVRICTDDYFFAHIRFCIAGIYSIFQKVSK